MQKDLAKLLEADSIANKREEFIPLYKNSEYMVEYQHEYDFNDSELKW